jgi:hypothetical protein
MNAQIPNMSNNQISGLQQDFYHTKYLLTKSSFIQIKGHNRDLSTDDFNGIILAKFNRPVRVFD